MLAILGMIIYAFRDTAGPILEQLKKTTPQVIAGICAMTVIYHLFEGYITTILVRQYNPSFSLRKGVENAFFCSFYRVATLGSGAGVAAIVFLGENDVDYSKAFGLYMLQYAFHKIGIAFFSMLFFVTSWGYMCSHFGDYALLLVAGYVLTFVITAVLILFCCSSGFHKVMLAALDFIDKKTKYRFNESIVQLHEQCKILEVSSKYLLKKKGKVIWVILLNIVKYGFWYGMPYLIFRNHCDVTLLEAMAVTSLSVMLAAVIPSPAGIGSTEFVMISLFTGIVGTGLAGSAALLYRFGTFAVPFLIGAVVVIARRIRKRRTAYTIKEI